VVREPDLDARALQALYDAKALAEERGADALLPGAVRSDGDLQARVLLLKGEPSAADVSAGRALAGPDRDAAVAALTALGIDTASVLAVCSRPGAGGAADGAAPRLARYLEAADPALAVALDAAAAADLAAAAGLPALPFGEPVSVQGRTLLAVDGLEASLADEGRKRAVWAQFKALAREKGRR
jgi:hypothetical protein